MSGEWHPWSGVDIVDTCSPPRQGLVDVKLRNGQYLRSMEASALVWRHNGTSSDVIAFRPSQQPDRGGIPDLRPEAPPVVAVKPVDPRITHDVLEAALRASVPYSQINSPRTRMLAALQAALERIDGETQARATAVTIRIEGGDKLTMRLDDIKRAIRACLRQGNHPLKRISKTNPSRGFISSPKPKSEANDHQVR